MMIMRMSRLFSQTLREAPADAEVASHQLLLRAGYIRQLGAGIFSYLPLARRAMTKIENIIRQEMNAIGGQEITMPVVHPADVWKESRRWYDIDQSLTRFTDRAGRDMVLAMTHEEIISDLVRKEIRSYRQLPLLLYHIQTKWRDEARPRAGLIRVREFTMKDSYSLDTDWEGLDKQYRAHYQAYFNIYRRCGLEVIAVAADVGMMGGQLAHEFEYLTPIGEDTLLVCDHCGYKANREVAQFKKPELPNEQRLPMEKVATPNATTIEALAKFLGIPESKTAKAVFMIGAVPDGDQTIEKFVFAIIRGDMEVNEIKLTNAVRAKSLRPATEEEIRAIGAIPGYGSPVGVKDALIVVDDAVPSSSNLVAGANEEGYHYLNTNWGRDYHADVIADIATAREGDACAKCGNPLRAVRGVEVGNIFKLGTRYSDALGCTFLDRDGKSKPIIMGSYGIGVGRLLACVAEAHHDDHGLILPISIAPYHIHLVMLPGAETQAEALYEQLQAAQIDVLYDDREERAGVKFNDADLIGIPIRLTVSPRALEQGGVEFKRRDQTEKHVVPLDSVIDHVQSELAALQVEVDKTVVQVKYEE
jgi:prolyl-tRNA synthetase